ncbi:MAG TPA: D-alanyl-D-alanine carboxypeptidase/D-alanyl-D-alanine-endopeptidase [Phycisphaerae bacterium]|nr:D-alanyl-D-alanine carboxypeptidase/D-alanyl-D-alanine-endopeptidase [Phycisphaerae bacterium]
MRALHTTLMVCLAVAAGRAALAADSLEARITPMLANAQLKTASVGIEVQEITPRGAVTLYSHDAGTPLGPASNCKLLTTAAAFEKYGPNAAFKTQLYRIGPDLLLMGGGDPGLGDAKLAAAAGETPTTAFEQWAANLRAAGILQYRDLVIDDRVFDSQWVHPNWKADQTLDWYSAPVAGLNFNANCLDWIPKITPGGLTVELIPNTSYVSVTIKATKGAANKISLIRQQKSNKFELRGTLAASATAPESVTIYDPGMWTGTILRDVLAAAGVRGAGQVRRAADGEHFASGTLLASHETPLMSVLGRANTNSLNMMAECLCKRLGYDSKGGREPGSWANGTAAVEAYAAALGVPPAQVSLDDGSGLSNKNKASAHAFATVLAHVAGRPDGQKFIDTLAQPGEDGTLKKRFARMTVADHVQAKTGHIDGVSTLSGYITTDTRRFAFSILCNKYQGNVNPWQDQVCQAIYAWAGGK